MRPALTDEETNITITKETTIHGKVGFRFLWKV